MRGSGVRVSRVYLSPLLISIRPSYSSINITFRPVNINVRFQNLVRFFIVPVILSWGLKVVWLKVIGVLCIIIQCIIWAWWVDRGRGRAELNWLPGSIGVSIVLNGGLNIDWLKVISVLCIIIQGIIWPWWVGRGEREGLAQLQLQCSIWPSWRGSGRVGLSWLDRGLNVI